MMWTGAAATLAAALGATVLRVLGAICRASCPSLCASLRAQALPVRARMRPAVRARLVRMATAARTKLSNPS